MNEPAFGTLLRDFRCAAGLSQEALAERARLSTAAISTLERSTRRAPQHQTLVLLAEALQLEPAERARLEEAAATGRRRGVRNGAAGTSAVTPHNLPNVLTSFHGREDDLACVEQLIASKRLITLLGAGGVGKTRLALETARLLTDTGRFTGGIWLVDLAPLATSGIVASTVARVLGIAERPGVAILDTLTTAVAQKTALVLLDNCEHVLDECARVAETLVRECGQLIVLATTREALRLEGECVVRVLPLPCDGEEAAGTALDLLLDRLIDADFTRYSRLSSDDRTHGAEICRHLDGIPLALELAAGRARDLSLANIVAGLDERFALLDGGRRTAAARRYTLRGMIDWSFALLGEFERELFARLALFAAPFTLEAATAVCADDGDSPSVRDTLTALVAKSLVTLVEDNAGRLRYRLLETMRAYAFDRLRERGDESRYARRFATYYCARARHADDSYGRTPNSEFLAEVEPEIDNFRTALEWSLGRRNDVLLGAQLAGALGFVFRQVTLFPEGVRWAERALAESAGLEPAVVGRLYMALSFFYFNIGGMQRALETAVDAETAYRSADARAPLAWSLTQQAYCLYRFGRPADARRVSDEAVRVGRASNDPLRLAGALNAFALTIPPERAPERFAALEEAIACYRAAGDADAIVPTAHLAGAHHEAGNYAEALAVGLRVVAMARKNRDRSTVSSALVNVAAYALEVEDADQAERAAREALDLVCDLGKTLNAMCALQHLASVAARRGAFVRSARLEGAADQLYREFGLEREFTEQSLHERTMSEVRAALGEPALRVHLRAGATAPLDEVLDEALAPA